MHYRGCEVESGLCVPDRPTLSYDFSHFRLGLPRPTDPPREAWREKKWPFWGGSPRPTDPLLPQRAGRELFLSLLSRFLPFFSDFDPDRPTRRAQRGTIFLGRKLRPTDPPRLRPRAQSPLSTSHPLSASAPLSPGGAPSPLQDGVR